MKKEYSLTQLLKFLFIIMWAVFLSIIIIVGIFTFRGKNAENEKALAENLSTSTSYFDRFFDTILTTAFTINYNNDYNIFANSPTTANKYSEVELYEYIKSVQKSLTPFGCSSVYVYFKETDDLFASNFGKTNLSNFFDEDIAQYFNSNMPLIYKTNTNEKDSDISFVLPLLITPQEGNESYIIFNLQETYVLDNISEVISNGYFLTLTAPSGTSTILGDYSDEDVFTLSSKLSSYNFSLSLHYPRQLFIDEFIIEYLQICLSLFMLVALISLVIFLGGHKFFTYLKPMLIKLALACGSDTSTKTMSVNEIRDSFDTLLSDRDLARSRLNELKMITNTKILKDILVGNYTDLSKYSKFTGVFSGKFAYPNFLVACINVSAKNDELLSKLYIIDSLSQKESNNFMIHAVEENDEYIGVLMNYNNYNDDDITERFMSLIEDIRENAIDSLELDFFISVVVPVSSVETISQAYRKAKLNHMFRLALTDKWYIVSDAKTIYPNVLLPESTVNRVVYSAVSGDIDEMVIWINKNFDPLTCKSQIDIDVAKSKFLIIISSFLNQALPVIGENKRETIFNTTVDVINSNDVEYIINQVSSLTRTIKNEQMTTMSNTEHAVKYIENATEFIEKNYIKGIQISDIAEHLSLNPKYLSRLFKKEHSMTIGEYLSELRIKKALELLEGTNLTIDQISTKVGYNDTRGFIRLFKKNYGVTPSKYRQASKTTEKDTYATT